MQLADKIKAKAKSLGLDACGIAYSEALTQEYVYLQKYIAEGSHGTMFYMERNMEKRCNPKELMPESESVIVVLMNYGASVFTPDAPPKKNAEEISLYAQATDYHIVLKNKLFQLQQYLLEEVPHIRSRCFVDTAPIMEKAWAVRAGLGWIGKHSLLMHPDFGSYCFIGVLLCSEPLTYDVPLDPLKHPCLSCISNCIKSCPTAALNKAERINASKCLSYKSIENISSPDSFIPQDLQMYYGCDLCQKNCLFNQDCIQSGRMFKYDTHLEFEPDPYLVELSEEDWFAMSAEEFNAHFSESPLLRLGLERMQRNIKRTFRSE